MPIIRAFTARSQGVAKAVEEIARIDIRVCNTELLRSNILVHTIFAEASTNLR